MPKKYYKKKRPTTRRRIVRRKAKRSSTSMVVSKNSPIPDRYMTRLKYTELVTLSYTGTNKYYQFNLNNLNDPNRTGSGHQPMGYDQLSSLYDKTRVHGCAYEIILSNTNAAYQGEVVVQLRPDSDVAASFEDAMEAAYRQYRCLGSEGAQPVTIKGYVGLAKLFGISKATLNTDSDFIAGIGGNPANQACLTIWAQNTATATAIEIVARVNLTFYAEFFERKLLGAS